MLIPREGADERFMVSRAVADETSERGGVSAMALTLSFTP